MAYDPTELDLIFKKIQNIEKAQEEAQERIFAIQVSNAERLYNLQLEQMNKQESERLAREQAINEKLIRMGIDANALVNKEDYDTRMNALKEWKEAALAAGGDASAIEEEYKKREAYEKDLQDQKDKAQLLRQKEEEKYDKARFKSMKKEAQGVFANVGDVIFGGKKTEDVINEMVAAGATREEAEKAVKSAKMQAIADAGKKVIEGFAAQLNGAINEVAYAQSAIDTRLQGSGQKTKLGSYWKKMSDDIIAGVGMSPFIKQADVVTSLKTLVGKGIAFNVEQRAFLDTISAKIADTFEAADSTLVKLVRIQQADTTAARLGMESALTAFLNSMYETTEYMTDAAAEIRGNLYEASALMGAKEATAFEYQVQKWMGSLYSVGFSNTSGLSGALGKLASGDISGINQGGYGNLLLMAANRANLSVAEILAEGLDDSETNRLMQAMVEYLQEIYAETKDSKVVQQQFASVYGITASDLKAAANLYGSTNNIRKNSLTYGGMIGRVNQMASSMWMRTGTGEMMTNLFDNLKYATASTIGNNPVLYSIYNIASMLDDTVGGINIPAFSVMGNMVDLETTVANLMRVGTVGMGLLGGIGKMMSGLAGGIGTMGMLNRFGVNSGLTTLSRGTGTGVGALTSGSSVSSSGYVGNSEGSDVQNQTMQSAQEEGNENLAKAQDESTETKLSTVDEHIVNIYNLLDSVVQSGKLMVDASGSSGWTDIIGGLPH